MHKTSTLQPYPTHFAKKHLIVCAGITGLIFTYAGVEESLLHCLTHPIFLLNLCLNTLYACIHFHFAYHLHFTRKLPFQPALIRSLIGFFGLEILLCTVGDYEAEDYTELFSITLPFGTLLVLIVNLIFHLLQREINISLPKKLSLEEHNDKIWMESTKGNIALSAKEISFAKLQANHLEIFTKDKCIRSFYSLKQMAEILAEKGNFFRLNKQYLANREAIESYKTLSDGRLTIRLTGGDSCKVSKNKASSFKKWIKESG